MDRIVQKMLIYGMVMAAVVEMPVLTQAAERIPNVVFILADNVGYGDMGPYGGGELRGAPTPRTDQLAREGLRLTQFLVEPACTPSRAALMTGQYSIRNGLSLVVIEGSPYTLPGRAVTMGELFKNAGYATAAFGKWHLGGAPHSLPTAHGFDEFYGIPPDISWDSATYVDTIELTHSIPAPRQALLARGPQIVEATAGGPLKHIKPFTQEVRADIDNELVAKSIDFMKRHTDAKKPFFLYLPFSMGHIPNLASGQFKGKSRIGNYGDKLMEGDFHVGQIMDTLKELGVENNTILVFASDNGPSGEAFREFGNNGTPDMGSPGPFRGELGEVTEGSIRTFCFIRWPGHVKPGTTSYAMFSIMDFFPTFAAIIGARVPADRPIDGVDQTDVLLGKSDAGHREHLLSFIGADLVAARWKQWRMYFTDIHPTGQGPQRQPGIFSTSAPLAGYPILYNIEMDPHEDLTAGTFGWVTGPLFKTVQEYLESVKKYPNPPSPNITQFRSETR
ncbi:Arylsulfatase A family protein [Nitrospira japonica]|uniref:Arylsulfatase A family protein n=1 Tax=Nitrospira japonica TaxID=1325564 RepID=A0A1W1I935_9BACT|nr:arylsulfatase [Nitrospira japonica]SLM49505.1 Arylsulfatase A family protein [Nitrospira japonica]